MAIICRAKKEINNFRNPFGDGFMPRQVTQVVSKINNIELLVFDRCRESVRSRGSDGILDDCYLGTAIIKRDPFYCEKTSSGSYNSRGECYTTLATLNIDEKFCSKIPKKRKSPYGFDEYNKCFGKIARIKRDTDVCNNINFIMVGKEINYQTYSKYDCYVEVAGVKGSMKICENMLDLREEDIIDHYKNNNKYFLRGFLLNMKKKLRIILIGKCP